MHIKEIAKRIGYSFSSTKVLLDRAEFADIRPEEGSRNCKGITEEHIKRMIVIKSSRKLQNTVKEIMENN